MNVQIRRKRRGSPHRSMQKSFRFFIFTSRNPESDFRRPLFDALRKCTEVYYIWIRRRPIVFGPGHVSSGSETSLTGIIDLVVRHFDDDMINIYFDSTDTCFPGLMLFIRLVARRGVWCLDMHDDLRYYHRGLAQVRQNTVISLQCMYSHGVLCAAPMLSELFPQSHHLGNASHILPLAHENVDPRNVLILTSFDARFDFDFFAQLAVISPRIRFHIHGWTCNSDPETLRRVSRLIDEHSNVSYHGPYTTADLPTILKTYRVTVAPYRVNSPLTRYIDPLRFYHCLNAGLDVISTDVPPARSMEQWIHIVRDPEHCSEVLNGIQSGEVSRRDNFTPITWDQRATRLVDIIVGLKQTTKLRHWRLC